MLIINSRELIDLNEDKKGKVKNKTIPRENKSGFNLTFEKKKTNSNCTCKRALILCTTIYPRVIKINVCFNILFILIC